MSKKIILLLFPAFFLGAFLFTSCKKSETSASGSFTWKYNDTVNSANLHKAYATSMATTPVIVATKGTSLRAFNVSLTVSSLNTGTYPITSGSANSLYYIDFAGNNLSVSTGSITITAYSNNLVSGNFSATVNDMSGVPRPITGSFTNTPVEP